MNIQQAYDIWSEIYDTNINRTRDLEAIALREVLHDIEFDRCLELGCGTGKNTEWLITKSKQVISVDLSELMLAKARAKINSDKVSFMQADITEVWNFGSDVFDLVTFSLMLEHISELDSIFAKAYDNLNSGGHIYIGELHPFKQYTGSKARFETESGLQIVPCFNHHMSDFIGAAERKGLILVQFREYFDDNDRSNIPRIFSLLFRKV